MLSPAEERRRRKMTENKNRTIIVDTAIMGELAQWFAGLVSCSTSEKN